MILIHYVNKKTGHCGVEQVLSLLQEQFWVVRGRAGVREITGGCISYRKQMSPKMTQEMAELPKIRLTPYEPPFTYSRVDYFGPFTWREEEERLQRSDGLPSLYVWTLDLCILRLPAPWKQMSSSCCWWDFYIEGNMWGSFVPITDWPLSGLIEKLKRLLIKSTMRKWVESYHNVAIHGCFTLQGHPSLSMKRYCEQCLLKLNELLTPDHWQEIHQALMTISLSHPAIP